MTVDPKTCPLCGIENRCGMAKGKSTCWCFSETIGADVLEAVSPEARGVACVCQACARGRRPAEPVIDRLQRLLRARTR